MTVHPFARENLPAIKSGQEFEANGKIYIMQGKLGDGAIGVVRSVIEKDTRKRRVIKILSPESKYIENASIDDLSARFEREGVRGKTLFHDNLVETIAYEKNTGGCKFRRDGVTEDVPIAPFIIMEYAGNRTLESYIRKDKGIPEKSYNFTEESLFIAHEVAKAVVYLHRSRHVHRDIKPANIFLTRTNPPVVKLGDFGIVKWSDFKAALTTGTLTVTGMGGLGTLKYMPPEQSINPKEVGVKSDIWPLGITLFELFTNQILPDYHYVYQVKDVRMERSNLFGRMHKLGLGIPPSNVYETILEEVLQSFLGVSTRPTSRKIEGILRMALDRVRSNSVY